jgi:hypothetical protein
MGAASNIQSDESHEATRTTNNTERIFQIRGIHSIRPIRVQEVAKYERAAILLQFHFAKSIK